MKILIIAIAALGALVGSAFFLGEKSPVPSDSTPANVINQTPEKPWIEVVQGKVFEFDKNGKLMKELKTGDNLEEGRTVDAGTGALANIYFGDGSILKIDSETKIEIQKGQFEKESRKLTVKIWLALGRVYSQIKSLSTLDSEWQVETPNAVAAVRGTAFGMEFTKGKSIVVVKENKVEVSAKDIATNQVIEKSKTIVGEKELVSINDKDIPQIKSGAKNIKIEKAGEEIFKRTWLKRAVEEEKKISDKTKFEEIQNVQTKTTESPVVPPVVPKELKILSRTPLEKLFEGEKIKFEAVVILSNGSEKTVTPEVQWQVLGGIGSVEKDGTFTPKLDDSVAEFGSAFGNIIATWKDAKTQKEFLGKTPIFKVEAQATQQPIENTLEPRG